MVPGERLFHQQSDRDVQGLLPLLSLQRTLDAEPAQLRLRARLTGAELHPAIGDEIERGDALRNPRWMVVARRHLHDPMAQADVPGSLASCRQKHLWRR